MIWLTMVKTQILENISSSCYLYSIWSHSNEYWEKKKKSNKILKSKHYVLIQKIREKTSAIFER